MRALSLLLLLAVVANPMRGDDKANLKKDQDALQGTWPVTSVLYNGKRFFDNGPAKLEFVIKGDEIVVQGSDAVRAEYARMKLKLDTTVMPRQLDLTVTGGLQKDAKMEGIYEIKDKEVRLCIKVFGNDRPQEFEAPAGSSVALLVLKKP